MIRILLTCIVLVFASSLQAQSVNNNPAELDLAIGAAKQQYNISLSFNKLKGVFLGNRIKFGLGVRAGYFNNTGKEYTTAPLKLISDNKIDVIKSADVTSFNANANIHIAIQPIDKILIGFNIDVIGLTFGSGSNVSVNQYNGNSISSETKPTTLNLLLGGDNDRGALSSEFYAKYYFNNKLAVRAGWTYFFSELKTVKKMSDDNARFRYKSGFPFAAIALKLF